MLALSLAFAGRTPIQYVHVCKFYFRKTSGKLPGNFREYVTRHVTRRDLTCFYVFFISFQYVTTFFHRFSIFFKVSKASQDQQAFPPTCFRIFANDLQHFSMLFPRSAWVSIMIMTKLIKLLPVNFRIASGNFRGPQNRK